MADIYYTNISIKQAGMVLSMVKSGILNITPNMARYIYSLALQGGGYAHDRHEEEFRHRFLEIFSAMMKSPKETINNRTYPNKEALKTASDDLKEEFRHLCAFETSKYLEKVKKEINQ